jgi:AcrR family transcriptional regulator
VKIAELARVSRTARSTIHFYRNAGLLPPPVRRGPKLHIYGPRHVRRLKELAALRAQGVSIATLQKRFSRTSSEGERTRPPRKTPARGDLAARERLLDLAAREFVARGFDGVRVSDLARAAGISKATFYGWFATKADLFVDCLDRLRQVVIGPEQRAALTPAMSFDHESRLRAAALIEHASSFRMMTNLVSQAATSADAELAERARAARHRMVTGATAMFERAIARGECRPLDSELLAYATWGALLALADRLAFDDRYTTGEALAMFHDFVRRGTAPG